MITLDSIGIRRLDGARFIAKAKVTAETFEHELHHVALAVVRRGNMSEEKQFHRRPERKFGVIRFGNFCILKSAALGAFRFFEQRQVG